MQQVLPKAWCESTRRSVPRKWVWFRVLQIGPRNIHCSHHCWNSKKIHIQVQTFAWNTSEGSAFSRVFKSKRDAVHSGLWSTYRYWVRVSGWSRPTHFGMTTCRFDVRSQSFYQIWLGWSKSNLDKKAGSGRWMRRILFRAARVFSSYKYFGYHSIYLSSLPIVESLCADPTSVGVR